MYRAHGLLQIVVGKEQDLTRPRRVIPVGYYWIRTIAKCEGLPPNAVFRFLKKTYYRHRFQRLMHKHLRTEPWEHCYLVTLESFVDGDLVVTRTRMLTEEYPNLLYVH